MAYFFKDIKLVESKQISSALKAIYGIGDTKGSIICDSSAVNSRALLSSLPQLRWRLMVFLIKRIGLTEVDLQRYRHSRFKSFNKLMTYKTLKLKYGLPVRGQSTRTNARTSRKLRRS